MKKPLLVLRKSIYVLISVIGIVSIVSIELFLLRDTVSKINFIQWNDLGIPPSEAEYVVEYGYVKCKDGKIYKNYSLIDPKGNWITEWLVVNTIDEYYSYDSDITACIIREIMVLK
jgi:hypothetical protein